MSVYVVGGVNFDAAMGVRLIARRGISAKPLSIVNTPHDYKLASAKADFFDLVLSRLKTVKADAFLVFCNTLSFGVDWGALEQQIGVPVLALPQAYARFIGRYDNLAVMSFIEHTLSNIRTFCDQENEDLHTIGFAMKPLVEAIEKDDPEVQDYIREFVGISHKLGAEAFVFGCTHFEDVHLDGLPIPVIYPGAELIDLALERGLVVPDRRLRALG